MKMKNIQIDWCKNFIKAAFGKHHHFAGPGAGIEVNLFWRKAEEAGLWTRGTYGSPMSIALSELTVVDTVLDADDNPMYHVFRLA